MPKVYLRATGPNSFEWVESLEKATAEYKEAANVTLKKLWNAELIEVPQPRQMQSQWVISRDE